MPMVSNIDRLVIILRQKLTERRLAKAGPGRKNAHMNPAGIANVRALAAVGDVDGHMLRRALIQAILVDELGEGLINDSRFQQVVERVTEALEQDAAAAALIDRVVADLKANAA